MEKIPETPIVKDSAPRIDRLASTLLTAINVTKQEISLILELEAEVALKELSPEDIQSFATKFSKLALYKEPGAAETHVEELLKNNASGEQTLLDKTIDLNAFLNNRKKDLNVIESKYSVKPQQETVKPSQEDELAAA